MKRNPIILFAVITFVSLLGIPTRVAGQQHHHYKLIDLGTLGGPTNSLGFEGERDLNNRGLVVSLADTPLADPYAPSCFLDCFLAHAVEWRDGALSDLGALPAVNNSGPLWVSDTGLVAGISQNGAIDPLTGSPEFRAVLWENGKIIDLGTLGGNESAAGGVNSHGLAAGCATNATPDPFNLGCFNTPQQSRAFLWRNGVIQDLGTLGGPDSAAGLVNERGQVAGWALLDSTPNPTTGIPTQHPFLWENGTMKDLGTIGGTAVFEINDLSNNGQLVGGMNVAGDQSYHPFLWDGQALRDLGTLGGTFGNANWLNEAGDVTGWATLENDQIAHAFLWQRGAMTDLGVVPGDQCSIAYNISSRDQVVGGSDNCLGNNQHAFVWENGSIADLNVLIPTGSDMQLTVAVGINEEGEIVAQGLLPDGDLHAALLIPCDKNHPSIEGCDYTMADASAIAQHGASNVTAHQQPNMKTTIPTELIRRLMRSSGLRAAPWFRRGGPQPQN